MSIRVTLLVLCCNLPISLLPRNLCLPRLLQINLSYTLLGKYFYLPEWDGLPAQLKMENLGHVLLIVESLSKKEFFFLVYYLSVQLIFISLSILRVFFYGAAESVALAGSI